MLGTRLGTRHTMVNETDLAHALKKVTWCLCFFLFYTISTVNMLLIIRKKKTPVVTLHALSYLILTPL